MPLLGINAMGSPRGNTFSPIDLDVKTLMPLEYSPFVDELRNKVRAEMTARYNWYDEQVKRHRWVNSVRSVMVWLGAFGTLARRLRRACGCKKSCPEAR